MNKEIIPLRLAIRVGTNIFPQWIVVLRSHFEVAVFSPNSLQASSTLKDIQFHWYKLNDRNLSRHEKSVQSSGISLNGSGKFLILMMAQGEQLL